MFFVYLDEFGHSGPFIHRKDSHHNTSPVFGLSGIILPEKSIRGFSAAFLDLKQHIFQDDILRARIDAYRWEKKGSDIFRPKAIDRYPELRSAGFRLFNTIKRFDGNVFYYGRQKIVGMLAGNSNGLHTTVFAHAIRRANYMCGVSEQNFVIVIDQHDARKELLECAAKTMYGQDPARRLISPPFEVESHLNQPIQAADWVSAIISRIWAYKTTPDQYPDHSSFVRYFSDRLDRLAVGSKLMLREPRFREKRISLKAISEETSMSVAFQRALGRNVH